MTSMQKVACSSGRSICRLEDGATTDSVAEAKAAKLVEQDQVDMIFSGTYRSTKQAPTIVWPKVLVIVMRHVPAIDSTGLSALRDVVGRFRRAGARVILAGVHAQPMMALQRSALANEIPEADLAGGLDDALAVAEAPVESS